MQGYLTRRIFLFIPTIFFLTAIVFFLVRFVPGSALDVIASQTTDFGVGEGLDREAVAHALGLDVPTHIQYIRWIKNIVLHGDLGDSIIYGRPVMQMIAERLPVTLELGILAIIFSILISIPVGVYSAVRQDTLMDYIGRSISILLIAIPGFWIATLVMIYPVIWFHWSPSMQLINFSDDPLGNLLMFLLPALILGASSAGGTMRITRTMMLEVMRQDYIRTAWGKGVQESSIITKHGLKNAFIPIITILGGQVAHIVGGAVIIENIFNLPGMGQLVLSSLNHRDYPVVSAIVLVSSFLVILVNLIVDISYSWLDPRVKYK
jgi:peptide/nickel transport system permease protein